MQARKGRAVFFMLMGLMTFGALAQASKSLPVERIFTANGDITGDGVDDQLIIHVSGRSMTSPFIWTLEIKDSQGHLLFQQKQDDSKSDVFFGQKGYVDHCEDYVSCKKAYYFSDLPKAVFDCLKPVELSKRPNRLDDMAMKQAANDFLVAHNIPAAVRLAAIAEMQKTLSGSRVPMLIVPLSPVQSGPPTIWVHTVSMFVPVFQE